MEQDNKIITNDPVVISVISYMTIVGWLLAALLLNNPRHPLVNFHIRQALGIYLTLVACGMFFWIPILGWIIGWLGYLAVALMWIIGLYGAIKGNTIEVPILGTKFQEWFQAL